MILTEPMLTKIYEAKMINVIDGDTIDMYVNLGMGQFTNARIRLLGIDAPEMFGVKKINPEYTKGLQARISVVLWFETPQETYYLNAEHKGIYGRWLGEIWRGVGEQSLNDWLKDKYYGSAFWEWHSQEPLIEQWYDEKEWHRYAEYDFANYGVHRYSSSLLGRYGVSFYGISKYVDFYSGSGFGYYGVGRYSINRYN